MIGALTGVLVAPRQPREVMRCLTDPRTRIVTLTITEKGYRFDAAGHLDPAAPDIAHDLRAPHEPRSAVGFIATALFVADDRRRLWPRFANTALGHRTLQVAMDSSLKLTQRHVPVVRERLARGQPIDRLALSIAGWIRYLAGRRKDGSPYEIDDPLASRLASLAALQTPDPDRCVQQMLGLGAVFGALGTDAIFVRGVRQGLARLQHLGVRGALRQSR